MAEIVLSAPGVQQITLDNDGTKDHSRLKNLDFETSGHTGFQQELSGEQLSRIDAVEGKENLSNKVTVISQESTDNEYPSAKAVYDIVESSGEFELVDSATFEENVASISMMLNDRYKELYIRFTMPSSGNSSSVKARWIAQTLNNEGTTFNKVLYNMGNQFIEDFTTTWYTAFHFKLIGKYCRTELWYDKSSFASDGYARGMSATTYSGYVAPSVPMTRDYIDSLKFLFTTNGGTVNTNLRYLPKGAKYEVWGIKR